MAVITTRLGPDLDDLRVCVDELRGIITEFDQGIDIDDAMEIVRDLHSVVETIAEWALSLARAIHRQTGV